MCFILKSHKMYAVNFIKKKKKKKRRRKIICHITKITYKWCFSTSHNKLEKKNPPNQIGSKLFQY